MNDKIARQRNQYYRMRKQQYYFIIDTLKEVDTFGAQVCCFDIIYLYKVNN